MYACTVKINAVCVDNVDTIDSKVTLCQFDYPNKAAYLVKLKTPHSKVTLYMNNEYTAQISVVQLDKVDTTDSKVN